MIEQDTPIAEAVRLARAAFPVPWTLTDDCGYIEIRAANGDEIFGVDIADDGGPDRFYALQMLVAAVNAYTPTAPMGYAQTVQKDY